MLAKFIFTTALLLSAAVARPSNLKPAPGALIVRQTGTKAGEYGTIQAAVEALGNSSAPASIYVYAGVYHEQVSISYLGPLTMVGETRAPTTYKRNLVTVTGSLSANTTGSNDLSATLRVHKDDFSLYNINLANTYGHPIVQAQALALSAWGERQGFYGSSFSGWQDTILTEVGTQYFGHCHVDGTTDFVFGEYGVSFFRESDVRPRGKGYICASKPKIDASGAYVGMYVFDRCTVEQAPNAELDLTGLVYLGRPWGEYARTIYTNSYFSDIIRPAGFSVWSASNASDSRTGHVTYAEYNNFGPGADRSQRANFTSALTASQAADYSIGKVLGSDWASWVDQLFL